MCKCDPSTAVPFCGQADCNWPESSNEDPLVITGNDRERFEKWVSQFDFTFGINRRWRGEGPEHQPYEYQNELVEFAWKTYQEALMSERVDMSIDENHDGDFVDAKV